MELKKGWLRPPERDACTKPATQWGFNRFVLGKNSGLFIGTTLGCAFKTLSDNPLGNTAFIARIFRNPSWV